MDMSETDISDEERRLLLRNSISSVIVHRDEDSLERKKARASHQLELERQESERYSRQYEEVMKAKQRLEDAKWENASGGRFRDIKKHGQVLFTNPQPCSYCDIPVVYPLSGWNQFRNTAGYNDLSIAYENEQNPDTLNFEKRHSCDLGNTMAVPIILNRKIEALRDELKELKESIRPTR